MTQSVTPAKSKLVAINTHSDHQLAAFDNSPVQNKFNNTFTKLIEGSCNPSPLDSKLDESPTTSPDLSPAKMFNPNMSITTERKNDGGDASDSSNKGSR